MPKFYTNIDLNKNTLKNAAIDPQPSAAPSNPSVGQIYFDTNNVNTTTYNRLLIRNANNDTWLSIPYSGNIVNADIASGAAISVSKINFNADHSVGGYKITNLADPVAETDAANKRYVDAAVANLNVHAPAVAATTTDLGSNYTAGSNGSYPGIGAYLTVTASSSTLTIDGKQLTAGTNYTGDRILVKNQTTQTQNGVYYLDSFPTASTAKLVRDTDYDGSVSGEVANGDYIFVLYGSQKSTAWIQSGTNPLTVGTSNLTFTQFTQIASYTASNGVKLTGGTNFELDNTTAPNSGMTTGTGNFVLATSPTLTTPTIGVATATSINKVAITAPATSATLTLFNGSTLATGNANSVTFSGVSGGSNVTVPASGTLATVPTGTNQTLPNKYTTTFTASSGNVVKTITQANHGLASNRNLIVQVSDSSGNVVYADIVISAVGQVTITFADTSSSYDTYDITIIG